MPMPTPPVEDLAADPRWFPLRYDPGRDDIHFAWLPREAHRALSFLKEEQAVRAPRAIAPRAAVRPFIAHDRPLHLIVHSGLTGSTLLARALDREGVMMTWKEPPIFTDVIRHRLMRPPPDRAAEVLADITALLARPMTPGETMVAKLGSVGNGLAEEIAQRTPATRLVCMHAPLDLFLAGMARKGLVGRLWGRKLFIGLRNAGLAALGYDEHDLFEQGDLQLAANAWLAIHRIMGQLSNTVAPSRLIAIGSEALFADPVAAIERIVRHLRADDAMTFTATDDALFNRHAKTGERYDPQQRALDLDAALQVHGDEIGMIVGWARKVAAHNGIVWTLAPATQNDDGAPA
jgi:hypothetical protein